MFFFFQAEDGIRDHCVTGVQTCALPIYIHQGRTDRCRRYRLEIRPEELPCSSAEANYLPCLHAEGFDDSIAGDGFVQDILNIGKLVLPATRSVPHPPADLPR